MYKKNDRQQQAKILRVFRKIHRTTGALLFAFFFIIAGTGLLLGWKKHSGGILLAKTHKGFSSDLKDWLPLDSLYKNACSYLKASIKTEVENKNVRIDARKEKGIVKFIFTDIFWGVQVDAATGQVLHIESRRSDFIEKIHDGSIADLIFGIEGEYIKLVYTTITGLALLIFTITGFWLWYGPKRMRMAGTRHST